jgi:hypothetical protein
MPVDARAFSAEVLASLHNALRDNRFVLALSEGLLLSRLKVRFLRGAPTWLHARGARAPRLEPIEAMLRDIQERLDR